MCRYPGWINYVQFETAFLESVSEIEIHRVNQIRDDRESALRKRRDDVLADIEQSQRQSRNLVEVLKDGPSSAVARELRKLEETLITWQDESKRLSHEIEGIARDRGIDHLAEIERLAANMAQETGDTRYRIRALLAQEIRRVIERIEFDSRILAASVYVKDCAKAYLIRGRRAAGYTFDMEDGAFDPLNLVFADQASERFVADFASVPGISIQHEKVDVDEPAPVEVIGLKRLKDAKQVLAEMRKGKTVIAARPPDGTQSG
jgi:hypothetical protein